MWVQGFEGCGVLVSFPPLPPPPFQEREVEVLKSLTPSDLLSFATSLLSATSTTRRKAVVAVRGAQEFTAPAAPPATGDNGVAAAAGGDGVAPSPELPSQAAAPAQPATPLDGKAASVVPPAVGIAESVAAAGEVVVEVGDVAEFKRGCEVWPNVGGLYAAKRKMEEVAAKM